MLALALAPDLHARDVPDGTSVEGPSRPAQTVDFLADRTFVDQAGVRHAEQEIFDAVFELIGLAQSRLVIDMFLFNDFQGEVREEHRALSEELTAAVEAALARKPGLRVLFVTDPVNTVYGGIESPYLARLERAGAQVVTTNLEALRDSNPFYSFFYRLLPRGLRGGDSLPVLPSPLGPGRVGLENYLALLNFKANHRKVVAADTPAGPTAIVSSANPHDGSSAHGNIALRFEGEAVVDLIDSELAVAAFSKEDFDPEPFRFERVADGESASGGVQVALRTEGKIGAQLDALLAAAGDGDLLDVAVFYLSDLDVVRGIVRAAKRGAEVRVLLDPNKDAFGYEKDGVPNRPAAATLVANGVTVRWCATHGEQCHAKMALLRPAADAGGTASLLAGSANFTRRNLRDFNLETSMLVTGPAQSAVISDAAAYFEEAWSNRPERIFSTEYETYEDRSFWKRLNYRIKEGAGLGTF